MDRVNVTLRRELGALITEELKDPRLSPMTSITQVRCSPDLREATVYVSVLGEEKEREDALKALESAAGMLRNSLGDRVRMRYIPRLRFVSDKHLADAAEMLALIDRVVAEDRERSGTESES